MELETETVSGEVLYETRYHAKRPYSSNYPPLPRSKTVNQGGFLSVIKEKWSDYRSNYKKETRFKRNLSLFVSVRGEYVAVATANQITILSKENDYQSPHAIFSCSSDATFTRGVWSENYGVLGVVDDSDTVYFIKANGEEITKITKKQLKLNVAIVGLIMQDDSDIRKHLCSFVIITADGCLHSVEVGKESSASVSNSGSATKGNFPKDVFCVDYDLDSSLLVVVGSAVGISQTSGGDSGMV